MDFSQVDSMVFLWCRGWCGFDGVINMSWKRVSSKADRKKKNKKKINNKRLAERKSRKQPMIKQNAE